MYRTGSSLGTTIYRDGDEQPVAMVFNLPPAIAKELASAIVEFLNGPKVRDGEYPYGPGSGRK